MFAGPGTIASVALHVILGRIQMPAATPSIFEQTLDASTIKRVESLMSVPYDQLSKTDAHQRLVLGTQRSRARLSSAPFYAKKEASCVARTGSPWAYWSGYWLSAVNTLDRPIESVQAVCPKGWKVEIDPNG